jgi:hypothetical protein
MRAILPRPYIKDIAWSPDGRSLAYLSAARMVSGRVVGTAIYTVDIATGRLQRVLTDNQPGQPLLPTGGQFMRLAWMRASR